MTTLQGRAGTQITPSLTSDEANATARSRIILLCSPGFQNARITLLRVKDKYIVSSKYPSYGKIFRRATVEKAEGFSIFPQKVCAPRSRRHAILVPGNRLRDAVELLRHKLFFQTVFNK